MWIFFIWASPIKTDDVGISPNYAIKVPGIHNRLRDFLQGMGGAPTVRGARTNKRYSIVHSPSTSAPRYKNKLTQLKA